MTKRSNFLFLLFNVGVATLLYSCKPRSAQDSSIQDAQRYVSKDTTRIETNVSFWTREETSKEILIEEGKKTFYWTYRIASNKVEENFMNSVIVPEDYTFLCFYKSKELKKNSKETPTDLKKYFLSSKIMNQKPIRIATWNWFLNQKFLSDQMEIFRSKKGIYDYDRVNQQKIKRDYYIKARIDSFTTPYIANKESLAIDPSFILSNKDLNWEAVDASYLKKKYSGMNGLKPSKLCPKPMSIR
jgi:hypothetical protein